MSPPLLHEVSVRSRHLCDDATFVHRVCIAALRYHATRSHLLTLPQTKEELKRPHERAIEAARLYRQEMRESGVKENSADMRAAAARIEISKGLLAEISNEKRLDANQEIEALARRLVEIFDAYSVPLHKLASFIDIIADLITPDLDTTPSKSSIEKAVSSARKLKA